MRLLPISEMSGSATPRASTRSLMRSRAFCITALSVLAGAARTTETPPVRSSPSNGRVPVKKPATAKRTRTETTTMETIRRRPVFMSRPHGLQDLRPVDVQLELAFQSLCSSPAHDHAVQEDLEVLHDVADVGIDRELEGGRSGTRVYAEERLFGRVVHPVVDVEVDLRGLSNAGAMDVRLVGQDDRGRDGADGFPALLLVVPDRRHDQRQVGGGHLLLEDVVHQERADLAVVLARHHVAHVVEVARDAGEARHAFVEVQ